MISNYSRRLRRLSILGQLRHVHYVVGLGVASALQRFVDVLGGWLTARVLAPIPGVGVGNQVAGDVADEAFARLGG